MSDVKDIKESAVFRPRGRLYEEFEIGERIEHHWGRTVTEADTVQFSYLTLSFNPLYFNREYAKALGHRDIVANPQLVFNIILGLTVEECSEGIGGPFLGVYELNYDRPVYPGDTLTAVSTTIDKRLSESDENRGIVSWRSEGFNQDGDRVVGFRRSNLSIFNIAKMHREGKIG